MLLTSNGNRIHALHPLFHKKTFLPKMFYYLLKYSLHLSTYLPTVVYDWELSRPFLCSKFLLFKTSWQMLKVSLHCFQIKRQYMWLKAFKWTSFHHQSSRGCKTVTFQSWRSEKIFLRSLFYFVKRGSNGSGVESFFDLQLWHLTVLQPLELLWWKVAHLKAPSNIY